MEDTTVRDKIKNTQSELSEAKIDSTHMGLFENRSDKKKH